MTKRSRFWYHIGVTAYQRIFEDSVDSYGLISTARAKALGIARDVLTKLVSRGRLLRVGHGLYKLACPMPYSADYEPYAQAVALVGPEAYLYGESVLAMLQLTPTNPKRMYVATPRRVRKRFDAGFNVRQQSPCDDVAYYEGVPGQSVADAIRSCIGLMMSDRLDAAIENGLKKELIDGKTARMLHREVCRNGEKT